MDRNKRITDPRYATPAADPETQRALRDEMAAVSLGLRATVAVSPYHFDRMLADMRIAAARDARLRRLSKKNNGGKQ